MKLKKYQKLKNALKKAIKEADLGIRGVKIASVIAEALHEIDIDPVLVGGAAVAFYSDGRYVTEDIDMLAPSGPDVQEVMEELGFSRFGKDYINKELNIYVEFPGSSLGPTERAIVIKVGDVDLKIVSIEDLIIDRLNAFKYWKSAVDGVNALNMLELGIGDEGRIINRAREDDVLDALDYIRGVLRKVIRQKINPQLASELLMAYFKKQP
ncbi:MAG: hypothetical protein ABIE74_07365 [Pseudomonadota bacterium]